MGTTGIKQALEKPANLGGLSAPVARSNGAASHTQLAPEKKQIGYGLPCSRCHAYYPADMNACPICQCPERVSPTARVKHSMVDSAVGSAVPATAASPQPALGGGADAERERLLKELKSQAFATHTQINPAATFRCVLSHQHSGATEPAAVCHNCYGEVRQQADRLEAALHIDPKEAAKIVYEAVWADTSDPNLSYFNAANALLNEIRNRAGLGLLLGAHKSMTH